MSRSGPSSRVVLRPGVHVVRRGDGYLQVGVDAPHRVVVSDDPATRQLLDTLVEGGRPPAGPDSARLLTRLATADLLAVPTPARPPLRARVGVRASGIGPDRVTDLLRANGLTPAGDGERGDVVLLVAEGPLRRSAADDLLADGLPHLAVAGTGTPASWRVGPFVSPGLTACLHCVDAHESGSDPRRTLVLDQIARLPAAPVPSGDVEIGLRLAIRDLLTYAEGRCPLTWSASVDVADLTVRSWSRHPECGCAWNRL